jgi:outer membrane protein OmpA-like peptidoglycan-associated protein
LPNANIVLRDSENTILGTVKSDLKGNYKFNVLPFETYTISVEKDGFVPNTFDFDSNKGDSRSYKKNILLETIEAEIVEVEDEEVIQVENILFEFDKSSLKEESTIALDKVYKVLMTHPEMIINLNAHSDQNGASSYNLKLSERRAASAKMYLINKGIDSSRIVSKGFGESKPLVDCKDKCTEEEDAKNRRVEFIIMK